MPTTENLDQQSLLRLMTWLSPGFPIGGYTYSHGIEYAIEAEKITDGVSLGRWIEGIVLFGAGRVDAAFFIEAWKAAHSENTEALCDVAAHAEAMNPTSEMMLEATAQGLAFISTITKVWPDPRLDSWCQAMRDDGRKPTYAVAVGAIAAWAEVPLKPALNAFLHAVASNLVSAGVRIVPLGQTAGQQAIADLEKTIIKASDDALVRPLDDLGSAALMVDWASAKHETQYTRLFRS